MTFHPPLYFHLRENHREELFSGIAEPLLMLGDGATETVPWLRYVTQPVLALKESVSPRERDDTIEEHIKILDPECSIGIGVDFVKSSHGNEDGRLFSRCIDWKSHRIHLFCDLLPSQISTLKWFHQT